MSTNFFQNQDRARRNTARLVTLFVLAVVALVGATYFPVLLLYYATVDEPKSARHSPRGPAAGDPELWHPRVFALAAAGTLAVIGLGSAYKVAELSGGGKAVAALLGAREVPTNTRELRERRLLNVVEEMAIASGVPVPAVFLLPDEQGINAFAAGHAPEDAAVAVSQGTLDYLTRDELQGVVAHEFSHILNGDMRLNIRLMGLIHGLIVLSLVGYYLIDAMSRMNRNSRRSSKGKGGGVLAALFLLGVSLYVLGSVGAFFGRLIQSAASRQREFLADASAVQFTRNPEGIGGALKKIGGLDKGSHVASARASEVSHMFFADAIRGRVLSLFDTHPPLADRIRAIDPHWDGAYPKVEQVAVEPEPDRRKDRAARPMTLPGLPQLPLPVLAPALAADAVEARIGQVPDDSRETAAAFEEAVTPDVRETIGETFSARAAVYALLLDADPAVRERQVLAFRAAGDPRDVQETFRLEARIRSIPPGSRLAVAHFAMPALRRMSPAQYRAFRVVMDGMIRADERVSLFEFCLSHLLTNYLDRAFDLRRPRGVRYTTAGPLHEAASCVLGLLAREGHRDAKAAEGAFAAGMKEWAADGAGRLPEPGCPPDRFAGALDTFEQAAPQLKLRLIRAATACTVTDRAVTGAEYEILRTLCAALDCPFPPVGPRA